MSFVTRVMWCDLAVAEARVRRLLANAARTITSPQASTTTTGTIAASALPSLLLLLPSLGWVPRPRVAAAIRVVADVASANTMRRKLLYSAFESCFGPSTQGAGTRTHLKSGVCAILKKKKGGVM